MVRILNVNLSVKIRAQEDFYSLLNDLSRNVNSNLSLKIRTPKGSFRVRNYMARNVNSNLEQAHLNSNLLQKTKQSTSKKERLKLKLIKLELQMIRLKPKTRKGEDLKQKTKQPHQSFKNFQTASSSSTTYPPTN